MALERLKGTPPAPKEGSPPPAAFHEPHGRDPWKAIGWLDLAGRAVALADKFLPAFVWSVSVECVGGPMADIRRVWYLAASAALGRARGNIKTLGQAMSVAGTWDITSKSVAIEISTTMNKLGNFNVGYDRPMENPVSYMMRGPEQLTVGAGWYEMTALGINPEVIGETVKPITKWAASIACVVEAGTSVPVYTIRELTAFGDGTGSTTGEGLFLVNILREIPVGKAEQNGRTTIKRGRAVIDTSFRATEYPYRVSVSATGVTDPLARIHAYPNALPEMPDEGRVITTVEKHDIRVQPPKPPRDGHTRVGLLALVAQTLQTPCFLPTTPPCTENPHGGPGVFLWDRESRNADRATANIAAARPTVTAKFPLQNGSAFRPLGPDGYPIERGGPPNITTVGEALAAVGKE